MEKGKVNRYSSTDRVGVIQPDEVRFFVDEVQDAGSLAPGQHVEYDVIFGPKGPEAVDVHKD